MKKFLFFFYITFFLIACQAGGSNDIIKDENDAMQILAKYVASDVHSKEILPDFSNCNLKYKQGSSKRENSKSIIAYTCTVPIGEKQDEIVVISEAPELKSEINPLKKQERHIVYIALLIHDKEHNTISGTKLLFDTKKNTAVEYAQI